MGNEYFFGSPLVTIAWIAATTVVISAAVGAISHRGGADRAVIVGRLEVVWLVAALAGVVILTLQPGLDGLGSTLLPVLNPVSNTRLADAVANVALFVPVGFFATMAWSRSERPVVRATGLAFVVSLSVEFAQWVLPIGRSAQTNDLIFNTLGGFIGAMAGIVVVRHCYWSDAVTAGDTIDAD